MIYSSWDIECDRLKLVIMGHFLPFYLPPSKNQKNQNFKKTKNHFTQVYQKPQSYEVQFLRYRVRLNFLSFWAIFCPFTTLPPNDPENQNFEKKKKKWKKCLKILSLYTYMCTINEDHMIYGIYIFLPFQPPDNLENQNFNIEKTPGDIITLHICTINDNHMMYSF